MRRTGWTPTVSPVGTLLVSSLVVAGILGCTALPSFISGESEEEAVWSLTPDEAADQPTTLERIADGARVEMAGSGFAMTLPSDWSVELAGPDPDFAAATPGDAWEALRAYGPERREACSMTVAIAPEGQERSGFGSGGGEDAPLWSDEDGELILLVRPPRLQTESGSGMESIAVQERPYSSDPRLGHDVLYVVACATDRDRFLDAIFESVEFLPTEG